MGEAKACDNLVKDFEAYMKDNYPDYNYVYVDDSVSSNRKCCIGLFDPLNNISRSFRCNDGLPPYIAEAIAIEQALIYSNEQNINKILIISGALSVITNIANNMSKIKPVLIQSINLYSMNLTNSVTIMLIPRHINFKHHCK